MALFDKLKEKVNQIVDIDKLSEKVNKTTGSIKQEIAKVIDPSVREQERLEKEIKALCEDVSGVGQVEVMLRLQGGTRVLYATDEKGKPASVGSGSAEQPLHSSILMPEVAGVAIVCRGGNSPTVQKTLTDLVSTALGIPANRVAVTGK